MDGWTPLKSIEDGRNRLGKGHLPPLCFQIYHQLGTKTAGVDIHFADGVFDGIPFALGAHSHAIRAEGAQAAGIGEAHEPEIQTHLCHKLGGTNSFLHMDAFHNQDAG